MCRGSSPYDAVPSSCGGERRGLGEESEYLTYSETLPLIPSIKDISLSKNKLQVSS